MLGQYYNDTITIGGVTLLNQSFAVTKAPHIIVQGGLLGIMGLGPRRGSAAYIMPGSPARGDYGKVPVPVWEHAFEEGYYQPKLFSVWLNDQGAKSGTILFGGIDESKFEGQLKGVPLKLSRGEFSGWSVYLTSIARINDATGEIGNLTSSAWSILTTLDTGSPNMYLPAPICAAITAPLNVNLHSSPSEPYVPCSLRSSRSSIAFSFPGKNGLEGPTIRAPYAEIIYPFGLPTRLGEIRGEDGEGLCHLGIIPSPGSVYLVGAAMLRSAYVVYDAEKLEVRMAQVKKKR